MNPLERRSCFSGRAGWWVKLEVIGTEVAKAGVWELPPAYGPVFAAGTFPRACGKQI